MVEACPSPPNCSLLKLETKPGGEGEKRKGKRGGKKREKGEGQSFGALCRFCEWFYNAHWEKKEKGGKRKGEVKRGERAPLIEHDLISWTYAYSHLGKGKRGKKKKEGFVNQLPHRNTLRREEKKRKEKKGKKRKKKEKGGRGRGKRKKFTSCWSSHSGHELDTGSGRRGGGGKKKREKKKEKGGGGKKRESTTLISPFNCPYIVGQHT